jgi:CRISPR-associated protein Csy2
VHSVGEWKSVHGLKDPSDLSHCLWDYHHEENWYLCKQPLINEPEQNEDVTTEIAGDFYEEDFN